MALPSSIETERNRYLMDLVRNASEPIIDWPAPNRDDVVLIGKIVMLYSYIDFNLRRMIEVLDHAKALRRHGPERPRRGRTAKSCIPMRCWPCTTVSPGVEWVAPVLSSEQS